MEPAALFKALGVETRLNILELLKRRSPIGTKEIARQLGISTAAVSQHLKILKQVGIVRSRREGYWIPYSIDEDALEHCSMMIDRICSGQHHSHYHPVTFRKDPREMSADELTELKKHLEYKLDQVNRAIDSLKE
jgi:ArsR family transcriptional regulator